MKVDPARRAAYDVLKVVRVEDAYTNLALPQQLAKHRLTGRDAAFATELASGTIRRQGTYDAIIDACLTKPRLEAKVRDALRLGCHQLLAMRVPAHAAISTTVDLVRAAVGPGPTGLVNAVLRKVSVRSLEEWTAELGGGLALAHSHPQWVVDALAEALGRPDELEALLAADNDPPGVTLVARPGRSTVEELPGERTPFSPYGVRLAGGDPGSVPAVAEGRAGVQDEGSQLVATALVSTSLDRRDLSSVERSRDHGAGGPGVLSSVERSRDHGAGGPGVLSSVERSRDHGAGEHGDLSSVERSRDHGAGERWLDLCAGPGGKAALLAAVADERGASLVANEAQPHRADLVRRAVGPDVTVTVADGREPRHDGPFDRVLVDAPCSGLGALRRRPEARWRKQPSDLDDLVPLQCDLLGAAIDATRAGGVVLYATCSPVLAETAGVVETVLAARSDVALESLALDVPDSAGPLPGTVQLWPHRHRTDAMFLALLRVSGE